MSLKNIMYIALYNTDFSEDLGRLKEQVTLRKDFGAYLTQEIHSIVPNPIKKLRRYRMTREKLTINTAVFPSLTPRCLISSQAKDTETTYL